MSEWHDSNSTKLSSLAKSHQARYEARSDLKDARASNPADPYPVFCWSAGGLSNQHCFVRSSSSQFSQALKLSWEGLLCTLYCTQVAWRHEGHGSC